VPNCFIAFTRWSLQRWLTVVLVMVASFFALTELTDLISTSLNTQNVFDSTPFALFFSFLLGMFSATDIRDKNYLASGHSYKFVAIAIGLSLISNFTALLGLVVLLGTVRTRITNESACSLPPVNIK
jgi:hypothetical protein